MTDTPTPLPEPTEGGSYTRDPVTGQLSKQAPEQAPAQPSEE